MRANRIQTFPSNFRCEHSKWIRAEFKSPQVLAALQRTIVHIVRWKVRDWEPDNDEHMTPSQELERRPFAQKLNYRFQGLLLHWCHAAMSAQVKLQIKRSGKGFASCSEGSQTAGVAATIGAEIQKIIFMELLLFSHLSCSMVAHEKCSQYINWSILDIFSC